MINIVYTNTTVRLDKPPMHVSTLLYEELKYRPQGYEHLYAFKTKRWDGYKRLFDVKSGSFRRGLLSRVCAILDKSQISYTLIDHTVDTDEVAHKPKFGHLKTFSFQDTAVATMQTNDIGILVAPTGSGKTICVAKLIANVKRRTLVLVTDVVLLDQMQQSLQNLYNQEIGCIGDGEFSLQDITVSTIQSVASILKTKSKSQESLQKFKELNDYIKTIGMVVSDEAHLADNTTFDTVMQQFMYTKRFYGLSATPYGWAEKAEKKQNLELEQHFGSVLYDCRGLDFIQMGVKSPLNVYIKDLQPVNISYNKHMKKVGKHLLPDSGKNYRDALEQEILLNDQYKNMVAGVALDQIGIGRSTFVHAIHSLEYGESLQSLIPGAALVNGSTTRKNRRAIYDDLRNKKILCMVSDIGGTGLDIPSLDTIILASDVVDVRQLKGRVERFAPNKSCGNLIDFNIDTQFLGRHHKTRLSQYENDNNNIGTL